MASSQAWAIFSAIVSRLTVVNVLLFLLGFVALSAFYQIIHYRFFHPLKVFPGPFWGTVTRLYITYHNFMGHEPELIAELHKKYGPVVRLTPTQLIVNDATRIPDIYHRQANKSLFYISGSFGIVESVFNIRDWRSHAYHRKLIAAPYSFTNIKRMEPLVDQRVADWIRRIDELFVKTGEKFNFSVWATYMAYDVVSTVGFGAPFGFIETASDVGGLIQSFRDAMPIIGFMARLYPLVEVVKKTFLGKYMVATPEHTKGGIGDLMRFRDRLFEQRLKDIEDGTASERVDFVQNFLDARTDDGKPLDREYVKAEILLVMFAGADTTGTAMQGLLHHLIIDEKIYSKVMTEIDAATRAGQLSAMPQYQEVQKFCPYYSAVVKEVMRLDPSITLVLPRIVSKGGLIFDGKFAPEGTEVGMTPAMVNRDERIYGKDAAVFRPERWLESEEKTALYNKVNGTFGWGTRGCLGKELALMEMHKGPVQFLRAFKWQPVEKENTGTWSVCSGAGAWKNIILSLERRAPVDIVQK